MQLQGQGGFGSVFEAQWRGRPVAVKVQSCPAQHLCKGLGLPSQGCLSARQPVSE